MMFSHRMTYELDLNYEVEIEPYVEGRYSGPPENCYPSEGGTATLTKVWITKKTKEKTPTGLVLYKDYEIPVEALPDEMVEELEKAAYEAYEESRGE